MPSQPPRKRAQGQSVVLPPARDDEPTPESLAERALVPLRYRFDGWTAAKQREFLAALAETGCVRDACRAVGRSNTNAYRLRARCAEFAAEWDRALTMAATVLEQVAFQRAVLGVEEEIWYHGTLCGKRRRYSDSLLRLLILRGDLRAGGTLTPGQPTGTAQGAERSVRGTFTKRVTAEETDRLLRKNLDALALRLRREARERAEAQAVRLLAAGAIP